MFGWFKRTTPERRSGSHLAEAVPQILIAYGDLLAKHPSAIMDTSWLPVDKRTMVQVFKIAWLGAMTDEARNSIEVGWALLPNFQEGVGETPITAALPEDQPVEETIAALEKFNLWGKLVVAEGNIMQRDRDAFKKANSV